MRINFRQHPLAWVAGSSFAQIGNAASGLGTNIIYARSMPLHDVGIIALINSLAMVLYVFLDRGLGTWITRNVASGRTDVRRAGYFVLRAFVPGGVSLLLVSLGGAVFGAQLSPDVRTVALLALPLTLAFWAFQAALSFVQGADLPNARSSGILLNGLSTLGATAIVVFVFNWGVAGAVLVSALAYFGVALWLACFAHRRQTQSTISSIEKIEYRTAILEARPLLGSNILTQLLGVGDVLIAGLLLPTTVVGQYQVAKKTAQAVVLPLTAALPMVLGKFSGITSPLRDRLFFQLAGVSACIFFVALVVATAFAHWAMSLAFGQSFGQLTLLVIVLLMAYSLQFFRDLIGVYVTARGNFARHFKVSLTGVAFLALATAIVVLPARTPESLASSLALAFLSGVAVHLSILVRDRIWTQTQYKLSALALVLYVFAGVATCWAAGA